MKRRGFLGSVFAAGIAPALCRASSLMPVRKLSMSSGGILVADAGIQFYADPLSDVIKYVRVTPAKDIMTGRQVHHLDLLIANSDRRYVKEQLGASVYVAPGMNSQIAHAPAIVALRETLRARGLSCQDLVPWPGSSTALAWLPLLGSPL